MAKEIPISEDGFIHMLTQQNGGALVEELDKELIKGIGAILDHGGESTIQLKFKIKKLKNLESAVDIAHDVVAKHPKEERPHKAMFITSGNGLSDQQQTQKSLELEEAVEKASVTKLEAVEKSGNKLG